MPNRAQIHDLCMKVKYSDQILSFKQEFSNSLLMLCLLGKSAKFQVNDSNIMPDKPQSTVTWGVNSILASLIDLRYLVT